MTALRTSPAADRILGCESTLHLLPSVASNGCRVAEACDQGGIDPGLRLVGLSFRSADVNVRSLAALSGERLSRFLALLREHGATEGVVLSTCNRTEVYFVGAEGEAVAGLLAQFSGLELAALRPHLYVKSGVCAACHLFRVAAGLDSAVLGETEIVAQVKSAWRESSFNGPTIDLVFQRALEASKRVRTETALCRNVTSLGSLAVREAERLAGPLSERGVLILGAGQIAERVAKELKGVGARRVLVLNRTPEHAREFAERFGFAWGSLAELGTALWEADVLFASATAPEPLVTREGLARQMAARAGRPLVTIDLGIPPNVEPGTVHPNLQSLDVDGLSSLSAKNEALRNDAIPDALNILESELERILVALTERQAAPTIKALVEHGEEVRQRTLEWAMEKLPDLDEKQRRVVEDLARRLVLGMLTPPIEEMKRGGLTPEERTAVQRAFRLLPEDGSGRG